MKISLIALLFVAVSVAAEPDDSTSGTSNDGANSNPPAQHDAYPAWRPETQSANDTDSDDAWSPTSNGVNYETGQVCLTRGAGGLCLDADDN